MILLNLFVYPRHSLYSLFNDLSQIESLKQLEEQEGREIRSFDAIAKLLSRDFPQLLQFILEEYQVEAEKTQVLIGREFIAVKRIADVIFIEYLWGRSYSKEVFNKSTLLKLMRERLNFRQDDRSKGRIEGRVEGRRREERAERTAKEISVLQLMQQEGKITREQMEYFLERMAEKDEKNEL